MFKSPAIAAPRPLARQNARAGTKRVDWVDAAKGICIILVVMLHTTLGLEKASGDVGWMHAVVAFSQPFRMPDFFLISGLFLAATIDRPWQHYLDRKVVHFVYFYLLWVVIQFAFKGTFAVMDGESVDQVLNNLAFTLIQPFGTLWFIYLLPVFFVLTKLCRSMPWLLLATAVALEMIPTNTVVFAHSLAQMLGADSEGQGWILWDEFAARYVYFLIGYLYATHIFKIADWARAHVGLSLGALALWALANSTLIWVGVAHWPVVSLMLGLAGALAIVCIASLIARLGIFRPLLYAGANSIVIYLAFFLPMILSRMAVLKALPMLDVGTMALVCTVIGVATPLLGYAIIKRTGFGLFLFHRPQWAVLTGRASSGAQKAMLRGAH